MCIFVDQLLEPLLDPQAQHQPGSLQLILKFLDEKGQEGRVVRLEEEEIIRVLLLGCI